MNNFYQKHFLTLLDFTSGEIQELLTLSIELKNKKRLGVDTSNYLKGKNIALLFEKDSISARCTFEVAAADLGINAIYIGGPGSQMGNKESIKDNARVLGTMCDGIKCYGYRQNIIETIADNAGIPVWNGLTDQYHPTQVLADFMTIIEHKGHLKGIKMAYLGDGRHHMGNSYLIGAAKMGLDYRMVGPKALWPVKKLRTKCLAIAQETGAKLTFIEDVKAGVKDVDVIATDVWNNLDKQGEDLAQYISLLKPYQVNARVMTLANPHAIFIQPLPSFHNLETKVGEEIYEKYGLNGIEVTEEVFESPQSVVFDQVENRRHTIKAIMLATMKENL